MQVHSTIPCVGIKQDMPITLTIRTASNPRQEQSAHQPSGLKPYDSPTPPPTFSSARSRSPPRRPRARRAAPAAPRAAPRAPRRPPRRRRRRRWAPGVGPSALRRATGPSRFRAGARRDQIGASGIRTSSFKKALTLTVNSSWLRRNGPLQPIVDSE